MIAETVEEGFEIVAEQQLERLGGLEKPKSPERLVECVPNFSEGRDARVIEEIVANIPKCGCRLLDVESDPSHNRCVVTFIGAPDAVAEAAFACAKRAAELIDMERHRGEHPRIGATDVIPFVPIQGVTMEDCVDLARSVGRRIADELAIPVYLYANAATRPDRVRLPDIRQGEYEGLKVAIQTDPARAPDFGPRKLHPTAGATAVGARPPLIAFNVNLDTGDIVKARTIAKAIRESSGGLPAVQAKGILIKETGDVQVTMNLLDYKVTSMETVMSRLEALAADARAVIKDSEIIGLLPLDALLDVAKARLRLKGFSRSQILDLVGQSAEDAAAKDVRGNDVREGAANSGAEPSQVTEGHYLASMDLTKFVDELAAPTGAPGGGAASAVAGILGCALIRMVAGNTLSKARFTEGRERLEEIRKASSALMEEFQALAQKDTEAYLQVEAAMRMPRSTEEEKNARRAAMQEAFKAATAVPLETAETTSRAMSLLPDLAKYGNPNAVTDMGVGALLLDTARRGASMNVQVNLSSIDDALFVGSASSKLESISASCVEALAAISSALRNAGLTY